MMFGHKVGITLSKENLSFSKFELKRLFPSASVSYANNLAIFETDNLGRFKEQLRKISYGKQAFEIVTHTEEWDDFLSDIEEADITQFALPHESYKIDSLRIGNSHQATDRGLLAGLINTTGELQVDVENPDAEFIHIKGENHTFAKRVWENDEPFTKRRNDSLPEPHPTAMTPRLGRAMVNVAQPENAVLDPFCGSGGVLIEAGLLGFDLHGIDYDSRMIERAQENLAAFDLEASLTEADATEAELADAPIITDVPYGKNSSTSTEASELFAAFLDRVRSKGGTAVICHPADESFTSLIEAVDADAPRFDFYVNKSLTRRITVLELS